MKLPIPEIKKIFVERKVWDLKAANWKKLKEEPKEVDWAFLERRTGEDALLGFIDILWTLMVKHIPQRVIKSKRSTHPWLNSRCRAAIIRKNNAEGTDLYTLEQSTCTNILREERAKYVEVLRAKLASLPRGSKRWWRINRELLHRKANLASIPPLRDGSDWLVDSKAKADAFATTFASKSKLPDEIVDTPFFGSPEFWMFEFVPMRTRDTRILFKKLDESKATGYDRISAAILKRLADELAMPFTRICRRLYYEGCWPEV